MATRETYQNGVLIATETIPDAPMRTQLYPVEIRDLCTPEERAAIFASTDPIVLDLLHWLGMIVDTVDIQGEPMQMGLGYLVSVGILTAERMATISEGAP